MAGESCSTFAIRGKRCERDAESAMREGVGQTALGRFGWTTAREASGQTQDLLQISCDEYQSGIAVERRAASENRKHRHRFIDAFKRTAKTRTSGQGSRLQNEPNTYRTASFRRRGEAAGVIPGGHRPIADRVIKEGSGERPRGLTRFYRAFSRLRPESRAAVSIFETLAWMCWKGPQDQSSIMMPRAVRVFVPYLPLTELNRTVPVRGANQLSRAKLRHTRA